MDSDDISRPDRCEKEMRFLTQHSDISVVGGFVEEFTTEEVIDFKPNNVRTIRVVPETPEDVIRFAKRRSTFNHPTVMYRKKDVLAAGNYQDIRFSQDYYLWIHMLIAGFKGYNLQEPLVYMRADTQMFKRRSGKLCREIQLNLFKFMREQKFISNYQYIEACVLRIGLSIIPSSILSFIFHRFLRKES